MPPAFEEALAGFRVAYADQNERDHSAPNTAIAGGSSGKTSLPFGLKGLRYASP
jgi:hypothetical protein